MVELGFGEVLSLAQTIGIVGTMFSHCITQKGTYKLSQVASKLEFSMTWMKKFTRCQRS
jgi:hypothetical protein